jgi:hypothetical protein
MPKNRYKKRQHFANLESEDLKHKVIIIAHVVSV